MKVLIVEDQPETVEAIELCIVIRWPNTDVLSTDNGAGVSRLVHIENPDLVILDLGLPGIDGLDVLEDLRMISEVPVIIVTAMGEESARVKGLEAGADDYIVKPFSHTELLARINAVLRRVQRSSLNQTDREITHDRLTIDFESGSVSIKDEKVRLTPTEWNLLSYLALNEGKVLPRDVIAQNVWGTEYVDESAIKMCVRRLRLKLGDDPRAPKIIHSHRGLGYSYSNVHD